MQITATSITGVCVFNAPLIVVSVPRPPSTTISTIGIPSDLRISSSKDVLKPISTPNLLADPSLTNINAL